MAIGWAGQNSSPTGRSAEVTTSMSTGARAVLEAFLRTAQLPYRPVPIWLEPPLTEVIPARFTLGRARGLEGDWDQAAEQGRLILEAVPSHVGAHGLLGDAMFARQQWQAAAGHYREYLQRQPQDVRALIDYGVTQIASERFDEAIDSSTRATRIDPANAGARAPGAGAPGSRGDPG